MLEGSQQTAPVTLTTTADATNLASLRAQFKATAPSPGDRIPGYTDIMVKLVARALQEHPALNQQWIDGHIVTPDGVHIAIAVDTPAGLLAPVIGDVPSLGLREIAARTHDLKQRAHASQLKPQELKGGTFTISNLGAFGIDAFTPIINVPQCAILGLGRIERRPMVVGDQIVPREAITLSLTFDHRIVDGRRPPASWPRCVRRSRTRAPGLFFEESFKKSPQKRRSPRPGSWLLTDALQHRGRFRHQSPIFLVFLRRKKGPPSPQKIRMTTEKSEWDRFRRTNAGPPIGNGADPQIANRVTPPTCHFFGTFYLERVDIFC